jgi:hypothetical protein
MPQEKVILGSEEWCSFPELGILQKAQILVQKHLLYMLLT